MRALCTAHVRDLAPRLLAGGARVRIHGTRAEGRRRVAGGDHQAEPAGYPAADQECTVMTS